MSHSVHVKRRNLFYRCNMLARARSFYSCSVAVKLRLFKSFCLCFYDAACGTISMQAPLINLGQRM